MSFLFGLFVFSVASAAADAPLSISELRRVPTTLTLGGRPVALKVVMWRSFTPTMPPVRDGLPLVAILTASPAVRIEEAWFVRGGELWKPPELEEQDANDPTLPNQPGSDVFRVVARGGPKWAPGGSVDVIVRVRDARGRAHLLRVEKQRIARLN